MRHSIPVAIALIAGNIALSAFMERTSYTTAPPPPPHMDGRRVLCPPKLRAKPIVITSESRVFCGTLIQTIDSYQSENLSPLIVQMHNEGTALCRKGMMRAGIVRLRRALVALKRTETP